MHTSVLSMHWSLLFLQSINSVILMLCSFFSACILRDWAKDGEILPFLQSVGGHVTLRSLILQSLIMEPAVVLNWEIVAYCVNCRALSRRHCPVWIDMLVWDSFANYLKHGTCCSIEVRVLCMLCQEMIDEHINDIHTNVCKHINVRFAFQSTNTFVHSNAVFFHCMYTDGLSRRWRDTAPFGTVWIDMRSLYQLLLLGSRNVLLYWGELFALCELR